MLILVGYAGSGKSSLAKRLSKALGVGYVDTDTLVEQSVGATVADIGTDHAYLADLLLEKELVLDQVLELV